LVQEESFSTTDCIIYTSAQISLLHLKAKPRPEKLAARMDEECFPKKSLGKKLDQKRALRRWNG
jgi:hypothetical protein